jgi:hypothetical protein
MINFYKFRKKNWTDQKKKEVYSEYGLGNFKLNPYSCLKTKLYIEASSLLILICIKLGIKPNSITAVYALLGLLGALMLSVPNDTYNVVGVIIFFFKGILDWTDGGVARFTNQTSKFGNLLDAWAGRFGHISFIFGLSCYLYFQNNEVYFLFLLIILLVAYSTNLKIINLQMCDLKMFKKVRNIKIDKIPIKRKNLSLLTKIKEILKNSFDDRARSVDLICLLILINLEFNILLILNFIFYFIVLRFVAASIYNFTQTRNFYK